MFAVLFPRIFVWAASVLVAIAISSPSFAMGSADTATSSNDQYKKAVKAIELKDFETAEKLLTEYVVKKAKDANGWNYLAYSQRNQGKNDEAMKNYNTALTIDPDYKGALEYQGELFLKLGDMDAAKTNLTKLEKICAASCEERDTLQAAIERVKDGKAAWVAPDDQSQGR